MPSARRRNGPFVALRNCQRWPAFIADVRLAIGSSVLQRDKLLRGLLTS